MNNRIVKIIFALSLLLVITVSIQAPAESSGCDAIKTYGSGYDFIYNQLIKKDNDYGLTSLPQQTALTEQESVSITKHAETSAKDVPKVSDATTPNIVASEQQVVDLGDKESAVAAPPKEEAPPTASVPPTASAPPNTGVNEQQVVDLVNKERAEVGLPALKVNSNLTGVAEKKVEDLRDEGYFAHNSPTYGSPFDMMKQFGIQYTTAGENLAKGQKTPSEVVNDWMNSEGHRANILNENYTEIGVGYVTDNNGGTYWGQMFISQ